MPPKRKRESLPVCGNPLYLNWVRQWEEEARQREDRNLRFTYKKATSILSGIGPKIVTQLEKRWAQHCTDHGIFNPTSPPRATEDAETSTTAPARKKTRTGRLYVPRHRSGAFALLLGLLKLELVDQTATRATLRQAAAPYTDTSFDVPAPGMRYTAWSSMNLLLSKELIVATGRPMVYSLTPSGNMLAEQLARTEGLFADELAHRNEAASA
ncbi:hypothetical protein SYNPS1DRAFT_24459, partial [Syncephalis pseudoplumigaleata]